MKPGNDAERAFDWVMREVQLPSDAARAALRAAWLSVVNAGHDKGIRALEKAWHTGAHWPSGEAYLRTLGWCAPEDFGDDTDAVETWADEYDGPGLMELLYRRLWHVNNRLYRDPQVRAGIDPASPTRWPGYTHVIINRDSDWMHESWPYGEACGYKPDTLFSIQEGLKMLREPAHAHPACWCTIDPHPTD
jgi:hypothetical protein